MELKPVYESYKNFGGRYVTIGSDAHRPEVIGDHFDETLKFIYEIGLIPVTLCRRKIQIL